MEREKLTLRFPILVEGKYDKQKILSVANADVLTTEGFGIFKNDEKKALLRQLSQKTPLLILTDSDGAGKLIRAHLHGIVPPDRLLEIYIPQIPGKEKRKTSPSKEGLLGVEGMTPDVLRNLLQPFADEGTAGRADNPLSKTDLFTDGLTGAPDSAAKRDAVAARLGLPRGMTPNAFLAALRILLTYEEYCAAVGRTNLG